MEKIKRISIPVTYIYTREQKRQIAKDKMKKEGKKKFCKHDYKIFTSLSGLKMEKIIPSFFSENWREYAEKN